MSAIKSMVFALLPLTLYLSLMDAHAAGNFDRGSVKTSVKPLNLSRPPTTDEIIAAGQLGGALFPTSDIAAGSESAAINLSFGAAMEKWNRHEYRSAVQLLKQHINRFPQSPWVSEAVLHLGCDAQYNGRYVEAQRHFERVLKENEGNGHPGAKAMIDKAKLRLAVLKGFQNNLTESGKLFSDLYKNAGDWRERTYAGHWIKRIGNMKRSGKAALSCGSQALAALLERDGRKDQVDSALKMLPGSDKGQSVHDIAEAAAGIGYPLEPRSFDADNAASLASPAIVHLPAVNVGDSGHYWLFEGKEGENLRFYDPQAGKYFVQNEDEFSKQWDGIALLREGSGGGKPLDKETSDTIFGGCCGVPRAEEDLGCPDGKCKQGPSTNGGTPDGSPTWTVNMVNMNFYMTDIPLWYRSPIGPPVEIQLSYNSQSAIAQNEPFGNKWQFNYGSYLVVDTAGEVTLFMPDGRRDVFRPNNPLNPAAGYQSPYRVYNTLTYLGPNQFELRFPEGMIYKYAIPAGTSSLQPFLVEIRDTHNQKLTFAYNASVQLASITDAVGKVTTLTYLAGVVTRVTDPFGRHADFTYDGSGNLTRITDMGGYSSSFSYDADVYLTSITNGGGAWQVYIEPADGIDNDANQYPSPGAGMWENYRITVTNPQGGKEEYYYDGYHGSGWYKSPRHYGTGIKTRAYEFTQTSTTATGSRGELYSISSPEGVTTTFNYDNNGEISQITDGHGHSTTYAYNSMGRITQTTMPNFQATTFGYAANGVDLTTITNGLGTIILGYNATTRDLTSFTDRMAKATTLAFNGYGQLTSITDPLPKTTNFIYNANHFLTQITRDGLPVKAYTYDGLGRVRTSADSTGVALTFDYNTLDDVTRVTWPDAKFIAIAYSPHFPHLITAITDRAGRTTSYEYDSLKRLTRMVDADGGVTRFTNDKDGNLTVLASPNGGLTRYSYNNDGRLKARVEADGGRKGYIYDSGGLLKTLTNGRMATATYLYDENDNLHSITYSDGTPAVTFNYDSYDRLTGMVDAAGTHGYTYDNNSRLTSIDGPWTNDLVTYAYDGLGRRTGITVQGGLSTTRVIDPLNRLLSVTDASGTYQYGYNGASPRISSLTRPNGSSASYLYDSLSRLLSVTNKNLSNATISSYAYTYNAQDQRSQETITNGVPFALANSSLGYTYDYANKLLSVTTPFAFTYDADGNMTGGMTPGGLSFTADYDAENRLVSLEYTESATAKRITYGYNGFGYLEKMERYSGGALSEQILYVRDRTMVHQERSSTGGVTDYTWGRGYGGGIGGLLGLKRGAAAYSYLYDGRGNVTGVTDASQATVASYVYDPFGVPLAKSGSLEQPYRFSTKPYDEKAGLYYYGYRFYHPSTGRWMTRDPLEEDGGLNIYQFANNNSLAYVDPTGKIPLLIIPIALGAGAAVGVITEFIDWYRETHPDTEDPATKVVKRTAEKSIKKACKLSVYKPADMKETEELNKEAEARGKDSVKPFSERFTGKGYEAAGALAGEY
jgi:RHS repeat-associated protein